MAMNWKIMGVGMALSLPAIYFLARGFDYDPRALPDKLTGTNAPDFVLSSLEGHSVRLSELKGSPVVLNFWASWCQPCLIEHPALLDLAERYKSKGVVFLGVLYGDEADNAERFVKQHGSAYPTLNDSTQSTSIDYGVAGVPETFVIDKDGVVIHKFTGPIDPVMLASILEGLL